MDVNYRISGAKEMIMKGLAYVIYAFNFLIQVVTNWFGIGLFISPLFMTFVYIFYTFWFGISGVSIMDAQRLKRMAVSWGISAIPVINLLYFSVGKSGIPRPGIVNTVARLIEQSQEEDQKKAEIEKENLERKYTEEGFRQNYRSGPSTRYMEEGDEEYQEAA